MIQEPSIAPIRISELSKGHAGAQSNLGAMYIQGKGVSQDYAEVVRWWRLAADQGYASAQVNLGVMYGTGEGVPEDDAEAVRWYRLAADQGHAGAQYEFGNMYAWRPPALSSGSV